MTTQSIPDQIISGKSLRVSWIMQPIYIYHIRQYTSQSHHSEDDSLIPQQGANLAHCQRTCQLTSHQCPFTSPHQSPSLMTSPMSRPRVPSKLDTANSGALGSSEHGILLRRAVPPLAMLPPTHRKTVSALRKSRRDIVTDGEGQHGCTRQLRYTPG